MDLNEGDLVRIRVAPDVDQTLWDARGVVATRMPEGHLLVELPDGADCTVRTDQIELLARADEPAEALPFRRDALMIL